MSDRVSTFQLQSFPTEVLQAMGHFLPHRLGLPTLNRMLYAVFSLPEGIAERALRRYPSGMSALIAEAGRSEEYRADVVTYLLKKSSVQSEAKLVKLISRLARDGRLAVLQVLLRAGVVELLLDNGGLDEFEEAKALRFSAQDGRIEVVRLFLDLGRNGHVSPEQLLYEAARLGRLEMVKFLLDSGTDVDLNNENGLRATVGAARCGHVAVVELLLDNGADIHLDNDVVLFNAVCFGRSEVAECLINRGANLHARSVLASAAVTGNVTLTQLLLDRGAGDITNAEPLVIAAQRRHVGVLELLFDRGADIHAGEDEALRVSALGGSLDAVRLLLDRGANIHACDDEALVNARGRWHEEVVEHLLARGANRHVLEDLQRIASVPEDDEEADLVSRTFD
ncbi:hypothetical protein HDU93_000906 [Gonapodya sp. JEL0774]|nr:hypothetical protein HDU93_000906 [Gonapodya sp. JEL0774]